MKNTMNMNDKQPTTNTQVSNVTSQLPSEHYHGGEQTEKLPGGGFHSSKGQPCPDSSY